LISKCRKITIKILETGEGGWIFGAVRKLFLSKASQMSQMTTKSSFYSTSIHHVEPYTKGFSIPGPSTYATVEAPKGEFAVILT
jgi:NADH:ubiquinone oxidoreductase subunit D